MGFITNLFKGQQEYNAQSGLQQGQLEQTYQQQQDAMKRMAEFTAAVQSGGAQGLAAQQNLLPQLQAMASGQGPSLAVPMLQQTMGDIANQQAAFLGSQRGASANVGLVGRQSARAAGDVYQRAASEAVTARSREQIAAIEQLRQQAATQAAQYQSGVGMQSEAALRAQQQALQAQQAQEAQRTAMAQTQESTRGAILGSTLDFAGKLLPGGKGPAGKAEGGEIKPEEAFDIVEFLNAVTPMAHGEKVPGKAKVDGDSSKNDTVPALLSPGEIVVPRTAARDPEKAAAFAKSVAMRSKRKKK